MPTEAPLKVIYKKNSFRRYATSRVRMAFKPKYLNADTILAESACSQVLNFGEQNTFLKGKVCFHHKFNTKLCFGTT